MSLDLSRLMGILEGSRVLEGRSFVGGLFTED